MDARTLSIKTIFGQDRRHQVPLFQRPYVWTKEEQWSPLWNDIRELAERLERGETPGRTFSERLSWTMYANRPGTLRPDL